jgi:hypothetical protein
MAINPAGAGGGFDWRVLLSAISSIAPELAGSRASRRSQNELAMGRAGIDKAQRNADARIGDEVMALETSTPEPHRAAAAADYTKAVRAARGGDASVPSNLGGARFQADQNAATSRVAGHGNKLAENFARIDAPVRQREQERQGISNAGVDVRRELGRAQQADASSRLRAQNRGRVDPWVQILSTLGSQIANNYQTGAEKTPGSDGLELIDLQALPDRLDLPRRIPKMRRMPTFGGG